MTVKSLFFVALTSMTIGAPPAASDVWTVDPATSSLGFEATQGGTLIQGTFGDWTADIQFDPETPETGVISAEIQTARLTTGNQQFDMSLPTADWFNTAEHPIATYRSENISLIEGNTYRADGTLSIRGMSQPVALDFTLNIDGDTARASGSATISRTAFKLGAAVGTDTVGDAVTVTLDLNAER